MKKLLLASVIAIGPMLMPTIGAAQSIETEQLGAAQAYDAGVIDVKSGGLDAAMWQGTSSKMAVHLLEKIPLSSRNDLVQDLMEAVVFSAGVPPEGSDSRYDQLRLKTVMQLGDKEALDNIASRNPDIARDPAVRADLALAGGDVTGACTIADNITEGRGEPVWTKLRAFCHIERGELSAAELTTELLQNAGHEDAVFYQLMKVLTGASKDMPDTRKISEPLYLAMVKKSGGTNGQIGGGQGIAGNTALNEKASSFSRLNSVFIQADDLTDDQIRSVFSQLAYNNDSLAGGTDFEYASFDLETAKADPTARGMAQLFQLANVSGDARSSAEAMALVLIRAERDGTFSRFAQLFQSNMAIIPVGLQAETNLKIFARAAIKRGDIGALQGFYTSMEDGPDKARIALVADALGNGFNLGTLGKDIEGRLEGTGSDQRRAVRDTFIAVAMGSRLSADAGIALEGKTNGIGSSVAAGDLLALTAAANAGSRAETALRSAILIEKSPLNDRSLAAVIEALNIAGLPQFSGRLAAEDFLSAL